jgi:hypothetical protein
MVTRVRTIDFLPEVFKTKSNSQFLKGSLDQLVQQPDFKRIQGYIGSKFGYGINARDKYLVEPTKVRSDYQLEPAVIFKKTNTNTAVDLLTYPGLTDTLTLQGSNVTNDSELFNNEFYSWDSFVNLDTLVNYAQYYWLPNGPDAVQVTNTSFFDRLSLIVTQGSAGYVITSPTTVIEGVNPTLTLIRGGTYTFAVNQTDDFWIQSEPGTSGKNITRSNFSTREVLGVENNGISEGTITFTVPMSTAQDTWLFPNSIDIDLATTLKWEELQGLPITSNTKIDGLAVQSLIGKTVIFYGTTPGTLGAYNDFYGDSYDDDDYSETTYTDITKHYYTITAAGNVDSPVLNLTETGLIPDNTSLNILYGTEYSGRQFVKNSYAEIVLIPYLTAPLDVLWYQSSNNPNLVGRIELVDPITLPIINILDILGKKTYVSPNNVTFTNGLKVTFVGNIVPVEYATGSYYVEGVGSAIELIPTEFFDNPPITEATTPDYITIARNSFDKNEWSRSNRWFHIDVLNATIAYNVTSPIALEALGNVNNRAKRPIIEFYPNLKLYNSGTLNRENVKYINFTVTDAFTQVAGTTSFYPDGSTALVSGDTIIFAGDNSVDVRNKIYVAQVSTVSPSTPPVITLSESPNGQVQFDQQVTVTSGTTYKQKSFYFDGLNWKQSQTKERKNQPPLFDVFDKNNNSFGDTEYYPSTTFNGCTLFEYATGSGADDAVLGFPIKYTSGNQFGDIVFNASLNTQTFEYLDNFTDTTLNVGSGFVFKYETRDKFTRNIGWQTTVDESFQYQVFNKVSTEISNSRFICDVKVNDPQSTAWPTIVVYANNSRLDSSKYTVSTSTNSTTITLVDDIVLGSPVDILIYSDQVSSEGYYQVPFNLDRNPFNGEIEQIPLGDIRGHYKSILNNAPGVTGIAFGANNYRDLGNLIPYGTKIIQNSASIVSSGMFLRNIYNFFDSLAYNSVQYTQFKTLLVDLVVTNDYTSMDSTEFVLDDILEKVASVKSDTNPFFWSDMIPNKDSFSTKSYVFKSSIDNSRFTLSRVYDFTSANYYGVLVYLTRRVNGLMQQTQLLKDIDYTISSTENILTVTKDLQSGDLITIKEYDQTYGSYVPNTPTKLGLYPKYIPEVIYDDSYRYPTYFIQGHDGSFNKLYGTYENGVLNDLRDRVLLEFEKRVFNNLKTSNAIPLTYDEIVPGQFRNVGYTLEEYNTMYSSMFLNWAGANRIDYQEHDYQSTNPYTFNYRGASYKFNSKKIAQGSWRGIYLWLYDTIYPDTKPWEMLGFTIKPEWWDTRYGVAPYTSGNTFMWQDIENGYVWNNGNPYINTQRTRPGLLSILPVDSNGDLKSPFDFLIGSYDADNFGNPWILGDDGPAEYSYLKSSTWPFDLMRLAALTNPAKFFALGIDVDKYKYDSEFGQYLFNGRYRDYLSLTSIYGNGVAAHSYMNWFIDYVNQYEVNGTDYVTNLIGNLDVRLTYRLAGFSDKDLLDFFVEKGSTLSSNNSLLIPEDNYSILLYDNQPTDTIIYSSIIVQKTTNGYRVYGNSQTKTYFKSFIPSSNGMTTEFTVNNNTIYVPKNYVDKSVIIPYGHEFSNVTELATFIRGYGLYLASQGLKFTDIENGIELSWDQMIYETYYWTLTGWEVGSTINVNPSARNIIIDKESHVVQPLTIAKDNFVLNQNLLPINLNDLYVYRDGTYFNVKSLNQGDSLSFITANTSTIEHVVVFDNETIFNDVIYNLTTGLRQQRMYVKGSKTAEWNGTVNAAGFIINQDNIQEWQQNTKYTKGTIVKFKNDYYIANEVVIIPSPTFDYTKWLKTSYDMIQKGLLPNPSTRAYESTLYYDTTNPNLESDADLLAFSLIGFRPRQYFAQANLDDATQVNLYKNMIEVKGTVSGVTQLEGINLQENTLNYDVHENWAIKVTEFGGILNQNFIEITLDETALTGNPSIASIVDRNTVEGTQQAIPLYNIKNYGRPVTSVDILPTIPQGRNTRLPSAGYVNLNDITQYGYNVSNLPDALINEVYRNDYLYVADKGSTWQVYTPVSTNAQVISVVNNLNGTVTVEFDKNHNLYKNQVMGILGFDSRIDGYHTVIDVIGLQSLTVSLTLDPGVTVINGAGISFLLQSQRVVTARDIPSLPLLNSEYSTNKVWVDSNVDGNWTVYEKTNNYANVPFAKSGGMITETFGTSVAYIPDFGYLVGDSAAGKVYVFVQADNGSFFLKDTMSYPGTTFGTVIAYSEQLVVITAPGPALGISQIYIYRIPTTNSINGLTLQQVITFGGTIGKSVTISQDSNLLYLGSEDNNLVVIFQLDRVPTHTGSGLSLAAATQVRSKQFICSGNVGNLITEGQRVSFSTAYTNLGVTTYYPITEFMNEFKVLGNQTGLLSYGDQVTFNTSGTGSTIAYTIGSFYVDEGLTLNITGAAGNGTFAAVSYAAQAVAPFQIGEKIIISGMTPAAYNGTHTVVACTTTQVTFASTATGPMTVAGTVSAPTITVFSTIENFATGTNINVGNPIYKITFSQDDVHTVVTSTYNSSTNKTTFLLQDEISYSTPSGSNIFIVSDAFSIGGILSSVLAAEDDKYGFSLTTNYDGSKLFVGAPYTDFSESLTDTGVVFAYDRLIINVEVQYDQKEGQPFVIRPPFTPTDQTRVLLNGVLLQSNQYIVIFGVIFIDDIGMVAGDILTVNSINFVLTSQLFSQDNLSDLRQGELFGYSLSSNKYGSELLVGVPFDVSNNTQKEGSVIRFTNAGKRFGRIQGVIECNLYEPTYLLLNGQIVNAFSETPLLATISTGATTCTISALAASYLPNSGVISFTNTLTGSIQSIAYTSVNATTGVITFAVPLPTKNGSSQTFTAGTTTVTLPLGNAANVANAINNTNIDNIRAFSTEDNRLQIFLLKNNLGQSNNKLNLGVFNGNFLTMLGVIDYVKSQVIQDPHAQTHTQFGYSVKFNQEDSFVVGAPSSDRYNSTTFDEQYEDTHKNTVFDNDLTIFEDRAFNAGSVYMYDYIVSYDESLTNIGNYIYAQSCNYTTNDYGSFPYYGQVVDYNDGVVMVGAPQFKPGVENGQTWIFANDSMEPNWHPYRESDPIVNTEKIQKAQLYDNVTNETLVSLDYIDPLQGKLLGVVGENLDFVSTTDPANYTAVDINNGSATWSWAQVGKLWFDTSTTKFLNYHQNDVTYNSEYWGSVFPGSTVTVYTWIESLVLPVLYEGPGTVYDSGKYSTVYVTDSNDNLVPKYYFWVRGTNQLFTAAGKTLTDSIIEQYIANPKNSGIAFVAPLRPNTYAFYNSKEYINNKTTNFHLGYSSSDNDNTGHQEFQLIRTNFTDDFLYGFVNTSKGYAVPTSLYDKYIDSFSGTDEMGAPVPDITLPKLMQSGVSVRPRQSFYYNRLLALQNYLEYANNVVKQYPINEMGNITFLYAQGEFYNTPNYWENIYWWAEGYSNTTKARFEVPIYSDLLTLTPTEGLIVGVAQNPQGKREVYVYRESKWSRIGLEDGTIQFLDSLWDYSSNQIGFGENFFDNTPYDSYPSVETRYIIRALNEQIYVGSLQQHRNNSLTLMFEYIQSESVENQNYLPWLTKTSFVDVHYTVRELTENEKFQRDNQTLLEGYINELKPYRVVLKDFYLKYSKTDLYAGEITDFDLPAVWNDTIGRFVSPQLTFNQDNGPYKFGVENNIWNEYQYSDWFNNYGTIFSEISNTLVTELSEFISSTQTYLYVKNSNSLPVTGVIRIGEEKISYGGISQLEGKLTGLIRGFDDTVSSSHTANASVYMDVPAVVVLDAGRDYASTPNVIAYVDLSKYPPPKREARLQAVMAVDKVASITVVDPGEGYVTTPSIVIESSVEYTSTKDAINFVSNLVQVETTDLATGELVYVSSSADNGSKKIIPDGYYYINVIEISLLSVTGTSLVSFYTTLADSIKGINRVDFTNSEYISNSYTITVGIRARARATMDSLQVRSLKPTLRFDRTSYRPMITPWTPNEYYSSQYISYGNDASSPIKLYDSLVYENVSGTVSPAGGTGATFTVYVVVTGVEYNVSVEDLGQDYDIGDVITILGTSLGGTTSNNCIITVDAVDGDGGITDVSVSGTPFISTEGIYINPSYASLQGALLPVTDLSSVDGSAVVTVDLNYSGLKPGQINNTYMYFFTEPTEANQGIYVYDDSLSGGAVIRISRPKFNPSDLSNLYEILIEDAGLGYAEGNEIRISGSLLGGQNGINDAIIVITKVNPDTSIFSATISGTANGDFGRYYVRVNSYDSALNQCEMSIFSDQNLLIPVSYASFIWNGTNTSYGYLPEQIVDNYTFNYNVGSVVSYAGYVWKCINANNDSEFNVNNWIIISSDNYILNALDRIEAYYEPTINMPGKDPQQLMKGISYPNNTYLGNKFAPEDEIPLDFILRNNTFYPRTINIKGVVFNGNTVVAVGDSTSGSSVLIYDNETSLFSNYNISEVSLGITDLSFSNGRYVLTTTNQNQSVWISDDAVNWFTVGTYSPYDFMDYDELQYDSSGLVVESYPKNGALAADEFSLVTGNQSISKSTDEVVWEEIFNIQSNLNQILKDIIYVDISAFTGYMAFGVGEEVTSGAGTAAPVISSCSLIYTSDDTTVWTKQTPTLSTLGIYGAVATTTSVIVVGESGLIYSTTNMSTWTAGVISGSPVTTNINSVAFGNGVFVAVGDKTGTSSTDPGLILRSTNGTTWTQVSSVFFTNNNLNKVTYGEDGYFYAAGENATILRSLNGSNWENMSNIQVDDPYYIVQGNDFLFGYGPEELVPGIVTDTLSMYVRSAPGAYWDLDTVTTINPDVPYWYKHTGFNMQTVVAKPDNDNVVSFAGLVVNPMTLSVFVIDDETQLGTRIYTDLSSNTPVTTSSNPIGYSIDWITETITLSGAISATESIMIEVYEVGNGQELVRANSKIYPMKTDGNGKTIIVFEQLYQEIVADPVVFVNGVKFEYVTTFTDTNQFTVTNTSENFLMLQFNTALSSETDYVVYAILATGSTLRNRNQVLNYSIPETQVYVPTGTETTIDLDFDISIGTNEDNAIVEVNGERLIPVTEYSFNTSTNQLVLVNSVTSDDIVAITTYNDTSRQWLVTDTYTGISVYPISYIDTSLAVATITFETDPAYSSGTMVYINGTNGTVELNRNAYYVKPVEVDSVYYYEIYTDADLYYPVTGHDIGTYTGGGVASESTFSVPYPDVPFGMDPMTYTEGSRTWITVNSKRIDPSLVIFGENNQLSIISDISSSDQVVITAMVTGASPNPMTFDININKYSTPVAYRTNLQDGSWLTEEFTGETDYMTFFNVSNLVESISKTLTVIANGTELYTLLQVNINQIKEVIVYNNTTLTTLSSNDFTLSLISGASGLTFTNGAEEGDSITVTLILGDTVEINGERIRFSTISIENNTISGLTRGVDGTLVAPVHPQYAIGYGINDARRLTPEQYSVVWESTDIVSTSYYDEIPKTDPLQISTTEIAQFLQSSASN